MNQSLLSNLKDGRVTSVLSVLTKKSTPNLFYMNRYLPSVAIAARVLRRPALASIFTLLAGLFFFLHPAIGQTYNFNYTGGLQTWVVPAGVTSIQVDVRGAQGGDQNTVWGFLAGVGGGRVQATLSVTPGQTLNIYVGGPGAASGSGGAGG